MSNLPLVPGSLGMVRVHQLIPSNIPIMVTAPTIRPPPPPPPPPVNVRNQKEKVPVYLKGSCALCLASNPNDSARVPTPTPAIITENDIKNLWSHILSNWNEFPQKEFTFLSGESMSSVIPHVCRSCSLKIAKVSKSHHQIVELERQLEALRKEMRTTVESIRIQMREVTMPSNRRKDGLKSSRFKRLLQQISEQRGPEEQKSLEMENTILYLGLVGDCKLYNPLLESAKSFSSSSSKGNEITSGSSDGFASASAVLFSEQRKSTIIPTVRKIIKTYPKTKAKASTPTSIPYPCSAEIPSSSSKEMNTTSGPGGCATATGRKPIPIQQKVSASTCTNAAPPVIPPELLIPPSSSPSLRISHVTSLQKEEREESKSSIIPIGDDDVIELKSEDEDEKVDLVNDNDEDDPREMDPLADNDDDGSRLKKLASLKRQLIVLDNSRVPIPQEKRKKETDWLPDIDIKEDSEDSEGGMDTNEISSALNLFRTNLSDETAIAIQRTPLIKIPGRIKSVELRSRQTVTVVKETPKVTLRRPTPTSIAKSNTPRTRVVTLKGGMTTTELDPEMTISERIAFIRKTIGGPPKSQKVSLGYPCAICHVPQKLREMLAHLKEAHHLVDYAFKCHNEKCQMAFFSKYSPNYFSHLRIRKECWTASGSPPLNKLFCASCGESCHRRSISSHLKSHETEEKVFQCPIPNCKEEFSIKDSVEWHLVTTHRSAMTRYKSLQRCDLCPFLPGLGRGKLKLRPEMMRKHLKNKHNIEDDDILKCNLCTFVFGSWRDLFNHWRVHLRDGKSISCDICDCEDEKSRKFDKMFKLRDHYFMEHGIGEKFICEHDNCEYSTYVKCNLDKHKKQHGIAGEKFVCEHDNCEYSTYLKINLDNHKKQMHDGSFSCEHCSRKLMSLEKLERHMSLCIRLPLKCKYCQKRFATEEELGAHEEGHFANCEYCGKLLLSNRINTHVREVHVKGKEREKGYTCEECGKHYKLRRDWRIHKEVDHLGNFLICARCGKKCRTSWGLIGHQRKVCVDINDELREKKKRIRKKVSKATVAAPAPIFPIGLEKVP